jgi:hypothetical protein
VEVVGKSGSHPDIHPQQMVCRAPRYREVNLGGCNIPMIGSGARRGDQNFFCAHVVKGQLETLSGTSCYRHLRLSPCMFR